MIFKFKQEYKHAFPKLLCNSSLLPSMEENKPESPIEYAARFVGTSEPRFLLLLGVVKISAFNIR